MASCSGSTRAPGIPSVIPSFSNLPSRAQPPAYYTGFSKFVRGRSRGSNFEASSSSTSGTLQRSSQGFPTTMGAERPISDRRATKHGTRILHTSTEICEVLTPLCLLPSPVEESSPQMFLGEHSKGSISGGQFEKNHHAGDTVDLEKELQDRSVFRFQSPFGSSALDLKP